MAYERQTDTVLTGGLNLLPLSANVPDEDAIALSNFRCDTVGSLRSRHDQALYRALGGYVHTLHTRLGAATVRYVGSGGSLYRDGAALTGSLDGAPVGLANMYGYTWVMNRNSCGRDNGTAYGPWAPVAPIAAPALLGVAGGQLAIDSELTYFVTGVDAIGEETNPSPAATITPNNPNQNVQVTRPAFADGSIVTWNVYRGGGELPDVYRVNADPLPLAQTTFLDSGEPSDGYDDEGLVKLGLVMQTDNDAPPLARGLAGPYFDRLLAWNSTAHSNWLYWSKQAKPYAWPGSALSEGNHTPVGEQGEEIVTVMLHSRHARIYKAKTIWRMTGDPDDDNSTMELANPEVGLIGENAIDSSGEIDYFQAAEGIYAYNGYTAVRISPKLDPLFRGDPLPEGAVPNRPMELSLAVRKKNVLRVINGRVYFSYAQSGDTVPSCTLVYDIATKRWASDDRGFTALQYEGQGYSFFGAANGNVYSLEQPVQTTPIALVYKSAYRDQQHRDRQKTYSDVVVEYSVSTGATASLLVRAYFNDSVQVLDVGSAVVAEAVPPVSGRRRDVFKIGTAGQMARSCAIGIQGTVAAAVTIYSIELHYYLEPRDAQMFDSDETNLGTHDVKRCDLVELDIDSTAAVDWVFQTDLPGGAMTTRMSGTLAATNGRRTLLVPLANLPEGRLVRLLLTTSGTFRLAKAAIRFGTIGIFLDGANAETHSTLELS